jgi:hypothetical protein
VVSWGVVCLLNYSEVRIKQRVVVDADVPLSAAHVVRWWWFACLLVILTIHISCFLGDLMTMVAATIGSLSFVSSSSECSRQ